MKKILFLLFISTSLFAQVEYAQKDSKLDFLPRFFIDLASYKSQDSTKSKMDIFIKVPYSNIQFLKTPSEYTAKYTLIVSLYKEDTLKLEKLWNEKVTTNSFKQTISQTSFNVSYKSFLVDPGEYKFVCKLEDIESRKYSVFEQQIKIRKFVDTLGLSDLVLASGIIETSEGTKIIPNIANLVTSKDSSLSFFYEIYSDKYREVKLLYSIFDKDNSLLLEKKFDYIVNSGINELNETIDNVIFSLGDYSLEIKLLNENNKVIIGTRKKFASKLFGFPSSIRDLDLAVSQMQFIATPSEINEIEDAGDYPAKLKKFIAYWKRLDPSPNTIDNETANEYYRRVDYANANFKGYFKGWKSDMGMVYITLGPPDQVTRRPFQMDSKPYEIWDYYVLNRSFIFVDQTNFGDYRLENPSYGDWFRYRP
ncbi:MAG: GWxTD domain-containing protein [Melioribacteraceae bacterium]|nr:GWxTD domain-containing protein [Melioribacteraceae bacterium]